MKFFLPAFTLTLACLCGAAQAQQAPPDDFVPDRPVTSVDAPASKIKYTLIMPEDKVPESVKANERNPFGKSPEQILTQNGGKATTEENNIREHLEKLHIVGLAPGPKGLRAMLGNNMLDVGDDVPAVIPDQTLSLRVGKITRQAIELVWVEKKPTGLPERTLILPVDLRPSVRYALPGQAAEKTVAEKSSKKSNFTMGTRSMPVDFSGNTNQKPGIASADSTPASKEQTPPAAPLPPPPAASPGIADPQTTAPNTSQDPDSWKRAVGFLNDLVKLEDKK